MKKTNLLLLLLILGLVSCSDKSYQLNNDQLVISGQNSNFESSPAGNLAATAIQQVHKLDIVLYPTGLMDQKQFGLVAKEMKVSAIDEMLAIYPTGKMDQFKIGTMRGGDVKKLITQRTEEMYTAELDVAGIKYHIHYVGGMRQFANFSGDRGQQIDDRKYYKVAVSNFFFFDGKTFPGYRLRNSLNFSLKEEGRLISARESLKTYLTGRASLPYLKEIRAKVSRFVKGDSGSKRIYEIQGDKHLSPIWGTRVQTSGIITAVARRDIYPGGIDLYIQDKTGDGNVVTSDAIHVYLENENIDLEIGDEIDVKGVVYEEVMRLGMSRTSIREAQVKKLASKQPLPEAVILGSQGRTIPKVNVSTYRGNLNSKPVLNMADGIDFYESLEGMRVAINNPRVAGFAGGLSDNARAGRAEGFFNLYLIPDGKQKNENTTPAGGIIVNAETQDYNPEMILITTNHMTQGLSTENYVDVGKQFEGKLVGVLGYEKNTFGSGEFVLNLPEGSEMLNSSNFQNSQTPMSKRPKTKLVAEDDKLTVATYNIENLGGNLPDRIKSIADSITYNLKCPDIVNLVEIQDNNGVSFDGSSSANETLEKLIGDIKCSNAKYESINIDPVIHAEGGQPGGNIRVAMIYNVNRVSFTPRGHSTARTETIIEADGSLSHNPGRVFPNSDAFKRTRKSLVAEFVFKGEKVFVIGNHFNSKLGDTSFWTNMQPPVFGSESRRSLLAEQINKFVQILSRKAPNANIVVLGDFNANLIEKPMMILEGDHLRNLVRYGNLIPPKERYTTSHNGNSQALDYIFVNKNLLNKNPECEILHFNSDYMGRLSDHDPVISRFTF